VPKLGVQVVFRHVFKNMVATSQLADGGVSALEHKELDF